MKKYKVAFNLDKTKCHGLALGVEKVTYAGDSIANCVIKAYQYVGLDAIRSFRIQRGEAVKRTVNFNHYLKTL